MTIPTLSEINALNGRIFAMLSNDEKVVLDFYRKQGRKYAVSVSIINEADPKELSKAKCQEHADEIMKSANSRIQITIGTDAERLWAQRHTNN